MTTSKTGILKGTTIELESAVPELDGKRVRVLLEPLDDMRLSEEEQRALWDSWIQQGPKGPIEEGPDTEIA